MNRFAIIAAAVAFSAGLCQAPPASARDCALPEPERAWIQQALDGWSEARGDLLRLPKVEAPRMLFYDRRCAWMVAAGGADGGLRFEDAPVSVTGAVHVDDRLTLPDGRRLPIQPMAFNSSDETGSFVVMATPGLWREDPASAGDPRLEAFFLAVALHELAHTRQLGELERRVEGLQAAGRARDSLDDDIIEKTFKADPEYLGLFERERDLLFQAAFAEDDTRTRALAREGLAVARERRARFLAGKPVAYDVLEDLFLNLEGVGCWVSFRMARRHPDVYAMEERTIETRGRQSAWVQAEGLALVLLIERLAGDQRGRLMEPELASPFALLAEALDEPWATPRDAGSSEAGA